MYIPTHAGLTITEVKVLLTYRHRQTPLPHLFCQVVGRAVAEAVGAANYASTALGRVVRKSSLLMPRQYLLNG